MFIIAKRINISLPEKLILEIDEFASKRFMDRSELIKNSLVAYMVTQHFEEERDKASEVSEVPVPEVPTQHTDGLNRPAGEISGDSYVG